MLVITRRPGTAIHIKCPDGTVLKVTIVKCSPREGARVGIDAPLDYRIERDDWEGRSHKSVTAETAGTAMAPSDTIEPVQGAAPGLGVQGGAPELGAVSSHHQLATGLKPR